MTSSFDAPSGLHLPQPSADEPASLNDSQGATANQAMQQPLSSSTPLSSVMQPQTTQANDQTDELDKEWISKAKLIVEQTKHDPFMQSKEMGKAKADYLRIRFNKHIKVGPDQTL